ncbi:MAG: DUF1566 domain-containing protein [Proteobacteria bacterium]|nr:DUF1566 domain-containing protein [Pseudomonadota bacterium]MBU4581308.1 DUF1566 domain-containing protein [Pseudomonadota bacterium]MCG2741929.1 DUF1566 domain-containing protein [Syntrophaceae bacterium]
MVQKDRFWLLCVFILGAFIFVYPAFAEIKVFEKEVEEAVSRGQSQEQVEAFALQKAKRLAVEEAGTYISSLTVVRNYQLQEDEVTALASGVVQAKLVGGTAVRVYSGVVHVKVKARIEVDTSVLDRQVQEIMKEKSTIIILAEERKKNRELEEKLANLKGSEVKRLEELNIQALALERDRDRQRLFREEQSLKAKGELSRAEADRIAKEREMSERIDRTRAEQEKAKRDEAAALIAEQDRIKRAQLENEQRWNDLARKAQLTQDQWVVIDDSLSLRQAVTEVNDLKQEIANLKGRLDYQYGENTRNLTAAYTQQRTLTTTKLPPKPAPKDVFETTTEYNKRISAYERQVKEAEMEKGEAVENLKKEETLKLAQAKVAYLGQQIRVLAPFIKRLQELQDRKFTFPEGGVVTIDLGDPDADNSRFPVRLQHSGKSWSKYWNYTDINIAKDFYRTRTYLKAEGLFQIEEIEEAVKLSTRLTATRVTHPGTKETREFGLETPRIFSEIDQFSKFQQDEATAKDASKKAAKMLTLKEIGKDGRFTAYDDGTVLDTRSGLMWAAKDNGSHINWANAKSYCENYRGGGYTDWRMPTQDELAGLYDTAKTYKSGCGYDVHLTELICLTCAAPWASETRGSDAAFFFFIYGTRPWLFQSDDYDFRALPVRFDK